jgi:hypothetical protein
VAQRLLLAPSEIHRLRFAKNKILAMSTEQIAKEEGIGESCIKQSIARVEAYRALNTIEALEASQVEVILFNSEVQKRALRNGLMATTVFTDKDGKVSREPDYETQLQCLNIMERMTKNLLGSKPGGAPLPSSTTNVNIVNAAGGAGVGILTFEDRLREVKRKRALIDQGLPVSTEDEEEFTPDWEGTTIEHGSS